MGQVDVITEKSRRKGLNEKDRYTLEKCLKRGDKITEISSLLRFHSKTIRREIQRGTVWLRDTHLRDYSCYKADYAQRIRDDSVRKRGRKHKKVSASFVSHVCSRLRNKYSPDAIVGEIRRDELFVDAEIVCTKTLYNWLCKGRIAGFKMDKPNKPKGSVRNRTVGFKNPTAKRITERPAEADKRESGHWEMDTVVSGKGGTACLLVLTERQSRAELMYPLKNRSQKCVQEVFDRLEYRYKGRFIDIFKSITCDNGSEFLDWESLERSCLHTGKRTAIYFAHPYSSWERGSNENANRLIRKFIKKGEDIGKLPVAYIKRIEKWINNYPRRIFGYKSANMLRNTRK